jgi:hypothetical protein
MIQSLDENKESSLRHPKTGRLREVASSKLSRQIKLCDGRNRPHSYISWSIRISMIGMQVHILTRLNQGNNKWE